MHRWLFLLLFCSGVTYAAHPEFLLPFVGHDEPWPSQKRFKQNQQWIECSDHVLRPLWCSDEFDYYSLTVWAEVEGNVDGTVSGLTIHAPYSRNRWSQFQLNLRKDGFQITDVTIGTEQFSVSEALETSTPQEADRSLMLFINQINSSFPQTMNWQNGLVKARLDTNGDDISLRFSH